MSTSTVLLIYEIVDKKYKMKYLTLYAVSATEILVLFPLLGTGRNASYSWEFSWRRPFSQFSSRNCLKKVPPPLYCLSLFI